MARGAVYALLQKFCKATNTSETSYCSDPSKANNDLWEEISNWVCIRNAVAHRGTWDPPAGTPLDPRDAKAQARIIANSHDGTFASGVDAMIRAMREAVRMLLDQALSGKL